MSDINFELREVLQQMRLKVTSLSGMNNYIPGFDWPLSLELGLYVTIYVRERMKANPNEPLVETKDRLQAHLDALRTKDWVYYSCKVQHMRWLLDLPPEREAAWRLGFMEDP